MTLGQSRTRGISFQSSVGVIDLHSPSTPSGSTRLGDFSMSQRWTRTSRPGGVGATRSVLTRRSPRSHTGNVVVCFWWRVPCIDIFFVVLSGEVFHSSLLRGDDSPRRTRP